MSKEILSTMATVLSIGSYSAISLGSYTIGFFIGIFASLALCKIMADNPALLKLYVFFFVANLIGFFKIMLQF
jgi:phage terminase large subunit-like protein